MEVASKGELGRTSWRKSGNVLKQESLSQDAATVKIWRERELLGDLRKVSIKKARRGRGKKRPRDNLLVKE